MTRIRIENGAGERVSSLAGITTGVLHRVVVPVCCRQGAAQRNRHRSTGLSFCQVPGNRDSERFVVAIVGLRIVRPGVRTREYGVHCVVSNAGAGACNAGQSGALAAFQEWRLRGRLVYVGAHCWVAGHGSGIPGAGATVQAVLCFGPARRVRGTFTFFRAAFARTYTPSPRFGLALAEFARVLAGRAFIPAPGSCLAAVSSPRAALGVGRILAIGRRSGRIFVIPAIGETSDVVVSVLTALNVHTQVATLQQEWLRANAAGSKVGARR